MISKSTPASRPGPTRSFDLSNAKITFDSHWWGFVLHLNEDATQLLEDLRDLGAKLLSWLGPELAVPVKAGILIEKLWIKAVDQGFGVRLVSPWISPTMLIPLPADEQGIDDTCLYWSVFDPSTGSWSDDTKFPAAYSEVGPAAAAFGDRLICVHRGASGDSKLWWTNHDPDRGWTQDLSFPAHVTSSEPALAEFQNKLYCAHCGDDDDPSLAWSTFDGSTWSFDHSFPAELTSVGPALAVFHDQLFCVYRGVRDDDHLYWTRFDGTTWSDARRMTDHHTPSQPALVAFRDRLYCVYRTQANDLAWTTFDGAAWSDLDNVGVITSSGAALAVHDGQLYCVYVGDGSDSLLYWCAFDGSAWTDAHRTPVHGNDTPALLPYRDKHGTRSHLMCIHRGFRT